MLSSSIFAATVATLLVAFYCGLHCGACPESDQPSVPHDQTAYHSTAHVFAAIFDPGPRLHKRCLPQTITTFGWCTHKLTPSSANCRFRPPLVCRLYRHACCNAPSAGRLCPGGVLHSSAAQQQFGRGRAFRVQYHRRPEAPHCPSSITMMAMCSCPEIWTRDSGTSLCVFCWLANRAGRTLGRFRDCPLTLDMFLSPRLASYSDPGPLVPCPRFQRTPLSSTSIVHARRWHSCFVHPG